MKPQTISIIGGRGKMGSLFADAFRKENYHVLVSDERNSNNIELAKQGDAVVVSAPLEKTEEVIQEIGPYVRKEALLTDFTSVKMKPVAAMLKYSQAEVIGGHPLFGPDLGLSNQNMILCPGRGDGYLSWYKKALESMGLKVTVTDAERHDKKMAVIQCLTHISNITFASVLNEMDTDLQEITTPAYLLRLYAAKRMLSFSPSLYSGILSENPFAEDAARAYVDAATKVSAMVQDDEKEGLEELLRSLQPGFEDHPALRKKIVKIVNE